MRLLLSGLAVLLLSVNLYAANYYVDSTQPDDTGDGTTWATAKQHIDNGVALLSSGDTLYIATGTYTGTGNQIAATDIPSGTAEAYTRILGAVDFGVILDGMSGPSIQSSSDYIEIRGIKVTHSAGDHFFVTGSHQKIKCCASDGNGGDGNSFLAEGTYQLFEDCYTWGGGRYPFMVYDPGQYVIFRRCVVRWDYSYAQYPQACFATYDRPNVYFQNCIAIDGKEIRGRDIVYDGLKAFFTPNGADNVGFYGCIALNMEGGGFYIENQPAQNVELIDCVAWDIKETGQDVAYKPYPFWSDGGTGPVDVRNCVFGLNNYGSGLIFNGVSVSSFTNCIVSSVTLSAGNYALNGAAYENYNCFYGNTENRNINGSLNANDLTSNPFASMRYLLRIEDGSTLDGSGSGSSDIGATILKRIGVDGSLYGETGWNTTTNINLWPYPNEEIIRTDCRAFSAAEDVLWSGSPALSGNRGFCADGTTLTKYIWEYLGNQMPSSIYGAVAPTTTTIKGPLILSGQGVVH